MNVTQKKLSSILKEIKDGSLEIPNFQREFVWNKSQVNALLDSIRKEIPIGTITLWNPPNNSLTLFEPFFSSNVSGKKLFLDQSEGNFNIKEIEELCSETAIRTAVIDGRQRLTSLLMAFGGVTFGKPNHSFRGLWYLDLKKNFNGEECPFNFMKYPLVRENYSSIGNWIKDGFFPLWLWQKDDIKRFSKEIENSDHYVSGKIPEDIKERVERLTEFNSVISAFNLAIYELDDGVDLSTVCDIFETLNVTGTKVSVYDIVNAKLFGDNEHIFNLKERVKDISSGSISDVDLDILSNWFDENGGSGGKTVCQIITGMYLGDENNLYENGNRKSSNNGGVNTFKGEDLINTPQEFYLKIFDKYPDGRDIEGFPGLNQIESYARDFIEVTNGVSSRNFCPYPIIFSLYCSLRYQSDEEKISAELVNESFRSFFWRAVLNGRYDQGFLTGAVRDRDELWEFLKSNVEIYFEDEDDWRRKLEDIYRKMDLSFVNSENLCEIMKKTNLKGAIQKAIKLFLFSRKPNDILINVKQVSPISGNKIQMHHIFPKKWVNDNCRENKEFLNSYVVQIPMLEETNQKWKSSNPRQALYGEHKENLCWEYLEDTMSSLLINQEAFDILINDKLDSSERFTSFMNVRAKYMSKQLELLESSNSIPSTLKYTNN